jgi:GNAT superfamily N-acetyltransferase
MRAATIRNASDADLPIVVALLERYMAESLGRTWEGSVEALSRDLAARRLQLAVAAGASGLVAFASWHSTYDVHHCAWGGEISDLFVIPGFRGRGIAPLLVTYVAREVEASGGRFVKGRGAEGGGGLSRRVAVICEGADCYVGGGAFRALARLADAPPRALAKGLPSRSANFEQ